MKRATATLFACLAVTAVLSAQGAKQPPGCAPAGGLSFVCGIINGEDLVLVPDSSWLLASGMAPGSGLHAVDTKAKAVRILYGGAAAAARADKARFANCPGPLDPKQAVLHGLSLRPATGTAGSASSRTSWSGRYTVYATNHGGRESIEVFDVTTAGGTPAATWIGCVLLPAGLAANSVAAFSDGSLAGDRADHARQDIRGCVRAAPDRYRARMEAGREDVPPASRHGALREQRHRDLSR